MNKKGFTLIELLVVVSIIGVLATMVLGSLGDARSKARDAKRLSELNNLKTALELYYLDNDSYPALISGGCAWSTPLAPLVSGGYISQLPVDPDGAQPFCYNYYGGSSVSSWNCGGVPRSNYEYALIFSLENENDRVKSAGTSQGFTHCISGPEK